MSEGASGWETSSSAVFTELGERLILTFPPEVTAESAIQIELEVLNSVSRRGFDAVIFDLSALTLLDLTEWRWLRKVAQEVSLLGAHSWLVGLRPSLIATLVTMEADLDGVFYALGVEEALHESSIK